MDPERSIIKCRTRNALTALVTVTLLTSCGPSGRATSAPQPVSAPVQPLPTTLEETRRLRSEDAALYQRALRALVSAPDPTTARRARTLLALDLLDRKQYEQAIPALRDALSANPTLAPYLALRIVDAALALGLHSAAVNAANSVIASAPSSSAAMIARLRLPALYAAAGDEAGMATALQGVSSIPIDNLTEREFVSLASALEKAGKIDAATTLRMRLLRDDTNGRYTEQIYAQLTSATSSPIDALSTEEATRLASALARSNRYDQALDLLRRIDSRPDAQTVGLYRSVHLRALFNSRNYRELLERARGESLDAPLELLRARAAWRSGRNDEFLSTLDRIEKTFPRSREATDAKVQRAKYYATDEIDYAKATANLEEAIRAGAMGNEGENLWTLGFTYVLWERFEDALRVFDRYRREFPDGDYKTNALFWTGKVHQRLGRSAERQAALGRLMAEYPYSYYAYRAREILGEPAAAASPERDGRSTAVFPDLDAELAKISDPRLDAVRELLAVDLNRDATREMKAVAAAYPDNAGVAFMLADVFVRGGEVFEAIGIVQQRFRPFIRHGGSNIPHRLWQILYPLDYWEPIQAEAQKRNLDPYLVASIIRQESGFEPSTVSNAGAVGLMQIMPAEASRIAESAGLAGLDRKQLFDPLTNIAVGVAEYAQKLTMMNGNQTLAIAAYNAGQEAVGRWIAQRPIDGDLDVFVDSIPYAETRLYVKSVTRNRFEYRRIYEGSPAVSQVSSRGSDPQP